MKTLFVLLLMWHSSYAPPVTKNEKEPQHPPEDPLEFIHYNRYLKEVVSALESDPAFKEKLEKASEDDIKSGNIANELHFVEKNVRDKLTELKRYEMQRLLDFKHKLMNEEGLAHNEVHDAIHSHLDSSNKHTFEIQDLKRLIVQTTQDLAAVDRRRREEFKQYELEKEYEKQDKLNHTNGAEREKLEKEYKEMEEKHKKHEPLHQPGHKAQLEEVWEKQDQMQQNFEPHAFFEMHDVNGDGHWDDVEVSALFVKQLNKLYEAGHPEDDLRERAEEMERMREAVFKEMDKDRDNLISKKEFLRQTTQNDFQQDHGWKGLDEERQFTDEEYQEYVRRHHQRMGGQPPPGYYPPQPQGYPQQPQGYPPQAQGYPPQAQGYPQAPQKFQHQDHEYQAIHEQYLPPQGQYHPPPAQYQHQQPPPAGQYQHQQPPPAGQQYQQQPPPAGQYQPQVPNQPLKGHEPAPAQQVPPQVQQVPSPNQAHQPPPPQVHQVQSPNEAGKVVQAP